MYLINPRRFLKVAVAIRISTQMRFLKALKKLKFQLLFSPRRSHKSGPDEPSPELTQVILEMKRSKVNRQIPDVEEITIVPDTPVSYPFA